MKLHRLAYPTLAACAVLAAGCSATAQERKYRLFFNRTGADLVPGYRLPPESEYGPLWAVVEGAGWQSRDGSGETKAEFWTSGDFNGDAVLDYAYILIEAADSERALYAFLSTAEGHEAVLVQPEVARRMGVATREPGRYATAGAAGAGPDSEAAIQEFEVAHEGIILFRYEGASSTFVWNEAAGGFDRYWTSD